MQRVFALFSWINALPQDSKNAVLEKMRPRQCVDGEAIYSLGDQGNELFMIESGKIRFCNYSVGGKEIQIGEMRKGDCFGEMSLLDGLERATYAYAVGSTKLLALSKKDFDQLYDEHHVIARQMNTLLSHRLRIAYSSIEDASVLTLKDRLARLLARLSSSVGSKNEAGVTTLNGFTHESLAHMLGSTRQGISRELKLLESKNLISLNYGKILIPDISDLLSSCDGLIGGDPIVPDYEE